MQQAAFLRFQGSDYISLTGEDIMQHKWLKKTNRLFLQALADLAAVYSRQKRLWCKRTENIPVCKITD